MYAEQLRALDYLQRKGSRAPVIKLREQLRTAFTNIETLFDSVAADRRAVPEGPGRWSAHQILDHLVLSHEPAIPQFASLLDGVTPEGIAIPANLQSSDADRGSWDDLRNRLGATHREFQRLLDGAADDLPLDAKALTEIVVKVDGAVVQWTEPLDWKAFVQGVRVHTVEHHAQLDRVLSSA